MFRRTANDYYTIQRCLSLCYYLDWCYPVQFYKNRSLIFYMNNVHSLQQGMMVDECQLTSRVVYSQPESIQHRLNVQIIFLVTPVFLVYLQLLKAKIHYYQQYFKYLCWLVNTHMSAGCIDQVLHTDRFQPAQLHV